MIPGAKQAAGGAGPDHWAWGAHGRAGAGAEQASRSKSCQGGTC